MIFSWDETLNLHLRFFIVIFVVTPKSLIIEEDNLRNVKYGFIASILTQNVKLITQAWLSTINKGIFRFEIKELKPIHCMSRFSVQNRHRIKNKGTIDMY